MAIQAKAVGARKSRRTIQLWTSTRWKDKNPLIKGQRQMNANERKHNINAKQSKEVWPHIRSRPKNKGMWATGKAKRRNPNLSGNIIVKLTKCASPVGVSNTNWDWKSQNTCHRIQLKPFQLRVDLYATMGEELGKRSKIGRHNPKQNKTYQNQMHKVSAMPKHCLP